MIQLRVGSVGERDLHRSHCRRRITAAVRIEADVCAHIVLRLCVQLTAALNDGKIASTTFELSLHALLIGGLDHRRLHDGALLGADLDVLVASSIADAFFCGIGGAGNVVSLCRQDLISKRRQRPFADLDVGVERVVLLEPLQCSTYEVDSHDVLPHVRQLLVVGECAGEHDNDLLLLERERARQSGKQLDRHGVIEWLRLEVQYAILGLKLAAPDIDDEEY